MQPLQCTRQCNSCNALGRATPAMHSAVQLLQCTASLPWGSGQCNSCNALPHRLGAVGSATPAMLCVGAMGSATPTILPASGQWAVEHLQRTASLPLPHCLGAVGSATPAMHCLTACGQWAVELLQRTASLPLPHCPGAVGSATPAMHCLIAWGQWAVHLLQCTATPSGGCGQWNSCHSRAHQLGGQGSLPKRRSLSKERNPCNALPHCLGAVGNATPAMHCLDAWGQWVVELLQCTATLPRGSGQCKS